MEKQSKKPTPTPYLQSGDIVVGFDPGLSTGMCVARFFPQLPLRFEILRSDVLMWDTIEAATKHTLEPKAHQPRIAIVERFTLYRHKAQDQIGSSFPSAEVIGIIRTWCFLFGLEMVRQPASVLERVGIPAEHAPQIMRSPHARDAYGHVRYFILDDIHGLSSSSSSSSSSHGRGL